MSLHENSRVLLKLLDGIKGTVIRLPGADHVTVLADGSGQPVRWRRSEVIELDEGLPGSGRPAGKRDNYNDDEEI
jgi:hypothetical protein